jgi:hypothetical protein
MKIQTFLGEAIDTPVAQATAIKVAFQNPKKPKVTIPFLV